MTTSPLIALCLEALDYPKRAEFNVHEPQQIQNLIDWLENTKIRQYPVDARQPLKSPDQAEWHAAMTQYAERVGCPYPWGGPETHTRVLEWVLGHAVGLEYADDADRVQ